MSGMCGSVSTFWSNEVTSAPTVACWSCGRQRDHEAKISSPRTQVYVETDISRMLWGQQKSPAEDSLEAFAERVRFITMSIHLTLLRSIFSKIPLHQTPPQLVVPPQTSNQTQPVISLPEHPSLGVAHRNKPLTLSQDLPGTLPFPRRTLDLPFPSVSGFGFSSTGLPDCFHRLS